MMKSYILGLGIVVGLVLVQIGFILDPSSILGTVLGLLGILINLFVATILWTNKKEITIEEN